MPRINPARSLQGIFIVWITVVTFRYATAIFQSLRTPISEESTLNGVLVKARSMPANSELADTLRQAGFAYILTSRSALMTPASWYPYLQADFLSQFAKMEFRDANVSVYRLKS